MGLGGDEKVGSAEVQGAEYGENDSVGEVVRGEGRGGESMSKLIAYGGIAVSRYMPEADLHGYLRIVAVAGNKHKAREKMRRAGFKVVHGLMPSQSVVELCLGGADIQAGLMADRVDILPGAWVCSLQYMYLVTSKYRKVWELE
jgi:hypothetical protein